MAKVGPSHLRPLTLRFLTGLAHAHTKKAHLIWGSIDCWQRGGLVKMKQQKQLAPLIQTVGA
ncbi:hypothetical protein HMPREF2861_08550 [Lactobacillus sp. HMSC068F07]|nr:hypothetical protein HMPREF2861_08550 [Lactobacillus sp. HMSC068F07]